MDRCYPWRSVHRCSSRLRLAAVRRAAIIAWWCHYTNFWPVVQLTFLTANAKIKFIECISVFSVPSGCLALCRCRPLIHAGMMELVDMRDLGAVTSVKVFIPVTRRTHSLVKAGLSCFINADQALSSASVPRRVKTEGNKIATGCPAAHICACDGIGRHARFRFSCSNACGFESLQAHQINIIRICFRWEMSSDYLFSPIDTRSPNSKKLAISLDFFY